MPDEPVKKGPRDRSRINLEEDHEVSYWSRKFGVTPDQLRDAGKKVGNSVETIERELKRAA